MPYTSPRSSRGDGSVWETVNIGLWLTALFALLFIVGCVCETYKLGKRLTVGSFHYVFGSPVLNHGFRRDESRG